MASRLLQAACLFLGIHLMAQVPVIETVQPSVDFPNQRIILTGSGFSATPAQLQVWFGSVKGTVNSSTEFSIEVTVPPQARLENIEVINLVSRLSGKATARFVPNYSGEGFAAAKLEVPLTFAGDRVFDVCACDLDGDGKPDLTGTKDVNPFTDLVVFKNNSTTGALAFSKFDKLNLASLNVGAPTGHITCGDLNGDGKPELVAGRTGTTSNSVFVLPNTSTAGTLSFGSLVTLNLENASDFARQVVIHDVSGDGKPDIIVANSFSNTLYIFQNQSSGGILSINPVPVKVTVTGASGTLALEIQDMNGDRKADIVATQNQSNDLFILKNQSSTSISFAPATRLVLVGSFNDLNAADFNRDGKIDLVASSVFSTQAVVLLNQSTTSTFVFTTAATLTTDPGPFGVEVNDINGDGHTDIVIPNRGTNLLNVFLHNGNATPAFGKVSITTTKNNWFTRVGDLDGDAKPDIAFTSFNLSGTQFSVDILRNKNCHVPKILNDAPLAICPTQTIRLRTIAIPGVNFTWNDGTSDISTGANPFLDITTAGNYTVRATGEAGACNVTSTPVFPVTSGAGSVPANPTITTNAPLCNGSTLTLGTATVAGASYTWEGPNNFSSALEDPSIPNVTAIHSGFYSLTVKVGDCTSNTTTQRVDVVDLASFSISTNTPSGIICAGQSAQLSVNLVSGYTYQWVKDNLDIAGQTSNVLNVTTEGTYKVRVTRTTAPTCSTETTTLDVDVYSLPVAAFTVDATACTQETLNFTSTSAVDNRATLVFAWAFGDTGTSTLQNPTHAYATAQTFNPVLTISYSGITGCEDNQAGTVTVAEAIVPDIVSDKTEICPGETAVLSVAGSFASLQWNTGATTPNITVTLPGNYNVASVDANGCEASDDIGIGSSPGCGEIDLTPPKAFTPDGKGDPATETWIIPGIDNYAECTIRIFDGRGSRVLEVKGYTNPGWDGKVNGKDVPEGTYFYVLACPTGKPLTGSVLIIRQK